MQKVLVIDDDDDLLWALQMALQKKGFAVQALSNGKECQTHIDAFQPQIIVLDIHLKEEDGRELCKLLKSGENYKHIPIILCSAYYLPNIQFTEYGANAFLSKPFSIEQMVATIQTLLN